jgi:hypothetical protein
MSPPSSGSFLLGLFFDPEEGGDQLNFNVLHGVTSQETELFIMETSLYTGSPSIYFLHEHVFIF